MSSCFNEVEWNMTNGIYGNDPPPLPGRMIAGLITGGVAPG